MSRGRTGRRVGARNTRGEILDAARSEFAARGFDRTTIRGVARIAGVDPALVHHYFGTKMGLFAAVGDLPVDPGLLLAGVADDPATAGFQIASRVFGMYDAHPTVLASMLSLMRAGVAQPDPGALRGLFLATVYPTLCSIVEDDTAELRASLVASQLAGLVLGRYILSLPAVTDVDAATLARAVAPALQHYVTGDLGTVRPGS